MRALPDPPQHTQRRDLALTSACRRSWSNQPARDDRRSLAPRSRLCSLRRAGECYERYAVPKAQGLMGDEGGGPARAEQRQPPGATAAAARGGGAAHDTPTTVRERLSSRRDGRQKGRVGARSTRVCDAGENGIEPRAPATTMTRASASASNPSDQPLHRLPEASPRL